MAPAADCLELPGLAIRDRRSSDTGRYEFLILYRKGKGLDVVAMKGVEKITIAVTPEMASMVKAAVDAGEYASTSEVFREALRLWKMHQSVREREIEELRRLWQDGVDSGPSRDGSEVFARLQRRYDPGS